MAGDNNKRPRWRGIILGNVPDAGEAVSTLAGNNQTVSGSSDNKDANAGFGMDNKDVEGSLKVHNRLDLEADIRIIAKIKGDIAIGLL
ncbi:hypothetical protein N0V91_005956 [Didymella pomorum]|uniref:Uncharacterized protein n=1 Tax=Didymella pomorum TaxID=749634 RepID=A0A9W9D6W9_9PLEO|nr:hypothetical protein N0V91_005956 [Didymella pomorum]